MQINSRRFTFDFSNEPPNMGIKKITITLCDKIDNNEPVVVYPNGMLRRLKDVIESGPKPTPNIPKR